MLSHTEANAKFLLHLFKSVFVASAVTMGALTEQANLVASVNTEGCKDKLMPVFVTKCSSEELNCYLA